MSVAALRGDYMRLKFQQHGSATNNEYFAGTTSFSFSSDSEFLESTDQSDGLNTNGIGGKVTRTISGNYIMATTADSFSNLYAHQAAGTAIEWEILKSGSAFMSGECIITSLSFDAGLSDQNVTGAYSMTVIGEVTTA